jgi:hypothetical protein
LSIIEVNFQNSWIICKSTWKGVSFQFILLICHWCISWTYL